MRRWHRNADPRLQELRRALAYDPSDVDLQHSVMVATVRAGELPSEAVDRLIPGRPVQPWQWVPASYVLLEAERIGRSTEWKEGKVEIEWISTPQLMTLTFGSPEHDPHVYPAASLPFWGVEGALAQASGARKASLMGPPDMIYFNPGAYRKTWVGARTVDFEHSQIVAGLDPAGNPGTQDPGYRDYVLSFLPPRWIPDLTHQEAEPLNDLGYQFHLDDVGGEREQGSPYAGPFPDVYDPQLLLHASARPRRARGKMSLRSGPLLDVRLINRVRFMERRGKRWV